LPELDVVYQSYANVTPYWQRRYFIIDIQHFIILVRNNIFQRNLAFASGIYCGLRVQNLSRFVRIWHFYSTMSRGSVFHWTQCSSD